MTKKYIRVGFTAAQKTELWERWRRGEQMKSIERELGKRSSGIFSHVRSTGGFTPPVGKRSRLALSMAVRLVTGLSRRRNGPGSKRFALNPANWLWRQSYAKLLPLSLNFIGHRSKLRVGSSATILTARRCTCHMKRSIRPYMCRHAGP